MKIKIEDIPKQEALILIGELLVERLESINKTLDIEIVKLKGIKKELLKLK